MEEKFEAKYDEFGTVFESSSKLRKISTEELQCLLDSSTSLSNAIARLGICVKPNYLNMLRDIIKSRGLDLSKMESNRMNSKCGGRGCRKYNRDEILCENSKYHRKSLKEFIISNNVLEYKCSECSIIDTYNDKHIVLQLDHINGISDDNRIENLRWLCPNCHSQTETYAGRNAVRIKKVNTCISCGDVIKLKSTHCRKCQYMQHKPKKLHVSKEELENLIKVKPMTAIGEMFGVSDNAIRKRCKRYGII
jgi:Zn finger protein HypA/HybF involved in hydrogenase expression